MTRTAVEHLSSPPTAVNCCHPRVWTKRELADAIYDRMGDGEVRFKREEGELEQSFYGDTERVWSSSSCLP